MFSLVFSDSFKSQRIDKLERQSRDEISIRGYNVYDVAVPPDLRRKKWFLPVNEIVSDYCKTDRYSYIKKFKKSVRPQLTWEMFIGRIIDKIYPNLFKISIDYIKSTKLENLSIEEELSGFQKKTISDIKNIIDEEKSKMIFPPEKTDVTEFLSNLEKLIKFEMGMINSIINFRISSKEDINLESEVSLLFPFNFKAKISAPILGFSKGAEPDFIYKQRIMGDIKTGKWRDFFNLTCAAYALAFENENGVDINLGIILNPKFLEKRKVPLYTDSDIIILNDIHRQAVLELRNKKITMIKNGKDPGLPKDETSCNGCCYYNFCWREKK